MQPIPVDQKGYDANLIESNMDELLPQWRDLYPEDKTTALFLAIKALARAATPTDGIFHVLGQKVVKRKAGLILPGDKVVVNEDSEHVHAGVPGVVQYHAPDSTVWVLLENATEAVALDPSILHLSYDFDFPVDHWCITLRSGDCINPKCPLHGTR